MIIILNKSLMNKICLLVLLVLYSPFTLATKTDPDFKESIELNGDYLDLNLNSGVGLYQGNFEAIQGSMRLQGNEIQVKQQKNHGLEYIVALGQPVKFQKKNYQTGELIKGNAAKITYDAKKLLITLEGGAEISSDQGRSIKSHVITYGLTTGEIEAKGQSQRRVQIIIPPSGIKESVSVLLP